MKIVKNKYKWLKDGREEMLEIELIKPTEFKLVVKSFLLEAHYILVLKQPD